MFDSDNLFSYPVGSYRSGVALVSDGYYGHGVLGVQVDPTGAKQVFQSSYCWEEDFYSREVRLPHGTHYPLPCMCNKSPVLRAGFNPTGNIRDFRSTLESGRVWVFNILNDKFYRVSIDKLALPTDKEYAKHFKALVENETYLIIKNRLYKNKEEVPYGWITRENC